MEEKNEKPNLIMLNGSDVMVLLDGRVTLSSNITQKFTWSQQKMLLKGGWKAKGVIRVSYQGVHISMIKLPEGYYLKMDLDDIVLPILKDILEQHCYIITNFILDSDKKLNCIIEPRDKKSLHECLTQLKWHCYHLIQTKR